MSTTCPVVPLFWALRVNRIHLKSCPLNAVHELDFGLPTLVLDLLDSLVFVQCYEITRHMNVGEQYRVHFGDVYRKSGAMQLVADFVFMHSY